MGEAARFSKTIDAICQTQPTTAAAVRQQAVAARETGENAVSAAEGSHQIRWPERTWRVLCS